jgi:hypothetical protein
MRRNPFRLTLAIIGIGGLALGMLFWLIGQASLATSASETAVVVGGIGNWLLAVGWLPFIAWLLVGALQWVAAPADARGDDARADGQPKTEAEIRAILKAKRDAG